MSILVTLLTLLYIPAESLTFSLLPILTDTIVQGGHRKDCPD